jgi:hypothetical protein
MILSFMLGHDEVAAPVARSVSQRHRDVGFDAGGERGVVAVEVV